MKLTTIALIVGAMALGLAGWAAAAPAQPGSAAQAVTGKHCRKHCREFEGRILSVRSGKRTFAMRDHHVGKVMIAVTHRTRFDHGINRFGQLHRGLRVEVEASRRTAGGAWRAVEIDVERHGHHGHHGHD